MLCRRTQWPMVASVLAALLMLAAASPLTLIVAPSSDMIFIGVQGGFTPQSYEYSVSTDRRWTTYSVSGTPSWLSTSSASGITPATVTFTTNGTTSALPTGTYSAIIAFYSGFGTVTRSAVVTIPPPPSPPPPTQSGYLLDSLGGDLLDGLGGKLLAQ